MGSIAPPEIDLWYKRADDGLHVFWSRDLRGLYVSDTDRKAAFNKLDRAINALAEYRFSNRVHYDVLLTYEEFIEKVDDGKSDKPDRVLRKITPAHFEHKIRLHA